MQENKFVDNLDFSELSYDARHLLLTFMNGEITEKQVRATIDPESGHGSTLATAVELQSWMRKHSYDANFIS